MTTSTLHSFAESNRSYSVNLTTTSALSLESNMIEIDEVAASMPTNAEPPTLPLSLCKIAE